MISPLQNEDYNLNYNVYKSWISLMIYILYKQLKQQRNKEGFFFRFKKSPIKQRTFFL